MIRPALGVMLTACLMALATLTAQATVVDDAPEATDYTLVYELPIPDSAGYNWGAVPYATD
ncbi:MAG: hypothetical protein VX938_07695, partial [Myxococcota bacterium]|nr:hypothetical protein [Myxococcota bacterium]